MKTEKEIVERLKLIEDCISMAKVLRLRSLNPVNSLEALGDVLKWVLDTEPITKGD